MIFGGLNRHLSQICEIFKSRYLDQCKIWRASLGPQTGFVGGLALQNNNSKMAADAILDFCTNANSIPFPFYLNQATWPIHTHIHTLTQRIKNTTQYNLEIKPIEYTICKRKLHTKLCYYTHKSVMTSSLHLKKLHSALCWTVQKVGKPNCRNISETLLYLWKLKNIFKHLIYADIWCKGLQTEKIAAVATHSWTARFKAYVVQRWSFSASRYLVNDR